MRRTDIDGSVSKAINKKHERAVDRLFRGKDCNLDAAFQRTSEKLKGDKRTSRKMRSILLKERAIELGENNW